MAAIRNFILQEDMEFITNTELDWNNFSNKTVLVAGANGVLPAYMIETLLYLNDKRNLKIRIIGLVRDIKKAIKKFKYYQKRKDFRILQRDITEYFTIKERVDYIIHAASQASPKYYHLDPVGTLLANVVGTYHLLELAKKKSVENFLYFSSGEIYGTLSKPAVPINESMYGTINPLDIRSSYGESKKMGENMCIAYAHQFGIPIKIVRPYHSYGPGIALDDGRVFADFVADIISGRDIVIQGNGTELRSFCYLSDATLGFFTVLLKGKNLEAYNVGNPACLLSIEKLAIKLVSLFPEKKLKIVKQQRLKTDNYLKSKTTIAYPDISKINNLGWFPKISIETGFKKTVESFYDYN
jgi:UDP-glucuronate decarboxylase